ncbi:hypothetical protein OAJ57_05330 [Alphaproteobacteria bacterium]|nr:hypothetical protein [Alphaproteobacteria bacterium]
MSIVFRPPPLAHLNPIGYTLTADYVGSIGETYILQFAAMCFGITALVLKFRSVESTASRRPAADGRWRLGAICAPVLVVAVASLFAAGRWHPETAAFLSTGIGRELNHAMAPVMAMACVTMAYFAAHGHTLYRALTTATLIIAMVTMIISTYLAFIAVYITLSALGLYTLVGGTTLKRLFITATLIIAVILTAITLKQFVRDFGRTDANPKSSSEKIFQLIETKLFQRQGVSGNCLDRVVRIHSGAEHTHPFYFLAAVVPRILWPEKPILSRGPEFGEIYCGQHGAIKHGHSESITLIGEPILQAGTTGLIAAQMFLTIFLVGITLAGTSGSPICLIVMAALLPWNATFQPNFAQYFGTAVKVFLTISPFIIVLAWCLRVSPRRHLRT